MLQIMFQSCFVLRKKISSKFVDKPKKYMKIIMQFFRPLKQRFWTFWFDVSFRLLSIWRVTGNLKIYKKNLCSANVSFRCNTQIFVDQEIRTCQRLKTTILKRDNYFSITKRNLLWHIFRLSFFNYFFASLPVTLNTAL